MTWKVLSMAGFLSLWPFFATAQKQLVIGKPGRPYKFIFHEGDEIRFKLKGERSLSRGLIHGLGYDGIRLHYNTIKPEEIAIVDVRDQDKSRFLHQSGTIFTAAGTGFLLIDQFNRTFIRSEPGVDEKSVLIGGALGAVGGILLLFKKKKVVLRRKNIIRIY